VNVAEIQDYPGKYPGKIPRVGKILETLFAEVVKNKTKNKRQYLRFAK
jgi:hypothetical protein